MGNKLSATMCLQKKVSKRGGIGAKAWDLTCVSGKLKMGELIWSMGKRTGTPDEPRGVWACVCYLPGGGRLRGKTIKQKNDGQGRFTEIVTGREKKKKRRSPANGEVKVSGGGWKEQRAL